MPRKLVANLFYSIDGVAADPFNFQYDSFDNDLGRMMGEGIAAIDTNILGRVTYQEWAGYWPAMTEGEDLAFADFINGTPKYVASRTLTQADLQWQNSQLIQGDLFDHIRRLKAQDGGNLAVQGSLSLVRQCVEAGLMDELTLIIHPAIAGTGRRLFDGSPATRLRLLRTTQTEKGNLVVTYGPFAESLAD